MRTLFLRIFLGSWLLVALVAAVLVVSSPWFTRSRPRFEDWEHRSEAGAATIAARVTDEIARDGLSPDAVREATPTPDAPGPHRFRAWIFGADGRLLLGQDPPSAAAALARRSAAHDAPARERAGASYLAASTAVARDAGRVVVVIGTRAPPRLVDLLEPSALFPSLLGLLAATAVLCFWMARQITAPVVALRTAAGRLSAGDLEARVAGPVTARRDEIGQLAREFNAMADRVQSLIGNQRRLTRDISHELRSPLARLGVALELARQRAGSARSELDRIGLEADRLEAMLAQLLALSQLETGAGVSVPAPVALSALVEDIAADASFEAQSRGCTVEASVPPGLVVEGDASLLRSALENVVRNAIRYTAPGSAVALDLVEPDGVGSAVIRVSDRGPGVPEADLEQIFEPFYRVEEARDRGRGGSGLGLAIAARAVALHGGTIAAFNVPAGGLAIEIRLPVGHDAGALPLS